MELDEGFKVVKLIFGLFFNAFIAYKIGLGAEEKHHGFWPYFLISFLLSPLVGIIVVKCLKDLGKTEVQAANNEEKRDAPPPANITKNIVLREGYQFAKVTSRIFAERIDKTGEYCCPHCYAPIDSASASTCSNCGERLAYSLSDMSSNVEATNANTIQNECGVSNAQTEETSVKTTVVEKRLIQAFQLCYLIGLLGIILTLFLPLGEIITGETWNGRVLLWQVVSSCFDWLKFTPTKMGVGYIIFNLLFTFFIFLAFFCVPFSIVGIIFFLNISKKAGDIRSFSLAVSACSSCFFVALVFMCSISSSMSLYFGAWFLLADCIFLIVLACINHRTVHKLGKTSLLDNSYFDSATARINKLFEKYGIHVRENNFIAKIGNFAKSFLRKIAVFAKTIFKRFVDLFALLLKKMMGLLRKTKIVLEFYKQFEKSTSFNSVYFIGALCIAIGFCMPIIAVPTVIDLTGFSLIPWEHDLFFAIPSLLIFVGAVVGMARCLVVVGNAKVIKIASFLVSAIGGAALALAYRIFYAISPMSVAKGGFVIILGWVLEAVALVFENKIVSRANKDGEKNE